MGSAMKKSAARVGLLVLVFALVLNGTVLAAPTTPVITTPTPQPTSTPRPLTLEERMALPQGEEFSLTYLPFVASESQRAFNAASFTYVVKPGDTLWSLALDFGRDLDTLSCVTTPTGADAEKLTPGQTIVVPALNDLCYTVRKGDTLAGIARHNKVTVEQIVAVPWNGFGAPPYAVAPKQRILLPGARTDARPRADRTTVSRPEDLWGGTEYENWPYGDGQFVWPVEGGWISQGAHAGHIALDIAIPLGTQVRAADRGKVIVAGWNPTGYGFRVVIDHGTDYVTLYAHLSDIYVEAGEVVGKSQVIGLSGANGNITGPHLHFEVRDYGWLIDPLRVLPK